MQPFIFTEIYNCGRIGRIAVESFHKHHNHTLHIFGRQADFDELGEIKDHKNNNYIDLSSHKQIEQYYQQGHKGTAYIFALVYGGHITTDKYIIHFDSDVVFKREAISVITDAFKRGYDMISSRRCFANNPGGAKGFDDVPDNICTNIFGFSNAKIDPSQWSFEYFHRMCEGTANPHPHKVLDFFDPVSFAALCNGAKPLLCHPDVFGGQDEDGKKINSYKSNLHIDMGHYTAHFGGVGSGYVWHQKQQSQNPGYAEWAVGRYALFEKIFYNNDKIRCKQPTTYGPDGRWINGMYDDDIYNLIMQDLEK